MDIQTKEALITEIEKFKKEALKMHIVQVLADSYTNTSLFDYNIDSDGSVIWYKAQARQLWDFWQAAKAQAVPEGFVLVEKVHPDAIVHNQGLSLFKECQVIYGWNGKSKDFKNALNRGFYHGVKLGAKAVLGSEIEAQEPAND